MRLVLFLAIMAGALAISSCATVSQAQNQCAAFGFAPGTEAYANCVKEQYQANQDNFQQRLLNASRISNQGMPSSENGSTPLQRSYPTGSGRICVYGRNKILAIRSSESCPSSIP